MNNKGTEEFLVVTKTPSKATLLTTCSCKIRPRFKEENAANCHGHLMLLNTSSNALMQREESQHNHYHECRQIQRKMFIVHQGSRAVNSEWSGLRKFYSRSNVLFHCQGCLNKITHLLWSLTQPHHFTTA